MEPTRPALKALACLLFATGLAGTAMATDTSKEDYLSSEAPPRLALVIGNREYDDPHVDTATHALHDARAMARRLGELRFDTVVAEDLPYERLYAALNDLRDRRVRSFTSRGLRPLVVVYFSGHGFNLKDRAFLAGRDVRRDDPTSHALAIDTVLALSRDAILVLLLDACRTELPPGKAAVSGEIGDGIADASSRIGSLPLSRTQQGTLQSKLFGDTYLIGYAALKVGDAASNEVAHGDVNSPYTFGLLRHLGSRMDDTLTNDLALVKNLVRDKTAHRQQPNIELALGAIYLSESAELLHRQRSKWNDLVQAGEREEIVHFLVLNPANHHSSAALRWLADDERRTSR